MDKPRYAVLERKADYPIHLTQNNAYFAHAPVRIFAPNKRPFVSTLIGYIKNNTGQFGVGDGCGLTNISIAVYSSTRTIFGQVGVGDILTDAGGVAINGGSQAWGYTTINGGTAERSIKLTSAGVVQDMIACARDINWYRSSSGVTSCGATGLTTALYDDSTDHDPGIYLGKVLFNLAAGQRLADGTYVVSNTSGGSAVYAITVSSPSGSSGVVTAIGSFCQTSPIMNAGSDASYNLPSPAITLSGVGFDPDGYIASQAWTLVSGPNTPVITTPTLLSTTITGVIAGTYVFRLTGTDNVSNTGSDDISISVFPAPLVALPLKIQISLDQVYGMEGEDYRGVYGSSWNYYDAGTCDPRNGVTTGGKFDYDSVTAGWQNKSTDGRIQRLTHDYFRADLPAQYRGRGVLTEFDTVKYVVDMYIYDSTAGAGNTIKFFFGNKTKAKQARWQQEFGDISPDYTYTTSATRGWYHVTMTGQDSAQYVYAVFSNFAINVAIVLYGGTSPFNTSDTSITRRRYVTYTDTAGAVTALSGANSAGALPFNNSHYFRDSLPYYPNGGRFYNAPFGSGSPLSNIVGMQDPDSVAFPSVAGATNRIDIGPFGAGIGSSNAYITDSLMHAVDGFPIMQNVRGTNGFYASHSGYFPEYKSKNDVTSNIRSRDAWSRFAYMLECLVAKFYQNTSPTNPSKYRYQNDRWPNQFGLNFFSPIIEVDNEKDEGFRGFPTDSCYMRPEELMFQQSIVYDTLKALQPSLTVLTQAFVSYNISPLRAEIKNAYLYYGNRRVICDGVSMHSTIMNFNFNHTPTSTELCGAHGEFPGTGNERMKMQNYILDIDREFGRHVPWHLTEWGYTKDSIGPVDCVGFTDSHFSLIGAPQVKSYTKFQSHAVLNFQAFIHYAGVQGLRTANYYTIADAVDTAGNIFANYKAADGSNGITNYINNPRILFPSYYYTQSFIKRFSGWDFSSNSLNVASGLFVDKWVCRSNSDSVMYIVFNQGRSDATNTTNINVGTTTTCVKWQPSFTSFDMAFSNQPISSGFITVTARPEADVYVTYQPSGSNPTINSTYILRRKVQYKRAN